MSENNNGLNEFNKRQIQHRSRRVRRRNAQRIAVLGVFLVLAAILIALFWLVILDIKENIDRNLPSETTESPYGTTEDPDSTTEGAVTTDEGTGTSGTTDATQSDTTNFPTVQKQYSKTDIYKGHLILVNTDHPFVLPGDMMSQLRLIKEVKDARPKVTVDGKSNTSLYFMAQFVSLRSEIINSLLDMTDACYTETKINDLCLSTYGAYRTFEEQKQIFESGISKVPAGCSDFNSGLAVYFLGYPEAGKNPALDDASYPNGKVQADWLEANAYKYGFIKRFNADKTSITSHPEDVGTYRYVGYPHAYIMKEQNLCLEEYLASLTKYTAFGDHLKVTAPDGNTYEIYYVPSEGDTTNVTLPASLPYTISGDNYGGFIVTVTLD